MSKRQNDPTEDKKTITDPSHKKTIPQKKKKKKETRVTTKTQRPKKSKCRPSFFASTMGGEQKELGLQGSFRGNQREGKSENYKQNIQYRSQKLTRTTLPTPFHVYEIEGPSPSTKKFLYLINVKINKDITK